MILINSERKYCFRITHLQNLNCILENGLVTKHHPNASAEYINIGNPQIIDVRSNTPVKFKGYGNMGDYVPFYFTPKSIMLYNILTGYYDPLVPKRKPEEILIIRCEIKKLAQLPYFFFTDGQGNDMVTDHLNQLNQLDKIDWENIQQCNFRKSDDDFDRARRYQAEFLVRNEVPVSCFDSLNVYNQEAATYVRAILKDKNSNLAVNIRPQFYFEL